MIVVDTNLISYLVITSEHTPQAENVLRKDREWAAPPLWRSELCNVLCAYLRRNEFALESAIVKIHEAAFLIGDREYRVAPEHVLELAHRSGCTAYDCEFVSLAEKLDVPLVTSDTKLLAAFAGRAVSMRDFVT